MNTVNEPRKLALVILIVLIIGLIFWAIEAVRDDYRNLRGISIVMMVTGGLVLLGMGLFYRM